MLRRETVKLEIIVNYHVYKGKYFVPLFELDSFNIFFHLINIKFTFVYILKLLCLLNMTFTPISILQLNYSLILTKLLTVKLYE